MESVQLISENVDSVQRIFETINSVDLLSEYVNSATGLPLDPPLLWVKWGPVMVVGLLYMGPEEDGQSRITGNGDTEDRQVRYTGGGGGGCLVTRELIYTYLRCEAQMITH